MTDEYNEPPRCPSSTVHVDVALAEIQRDLKYVKDAVAELRTDMREDVVQLRRDFEDFVTHSEFFPVKMIAYGLAGGVMLTVLGALLAKVVVQ